MLCSGPGRILKLLAQVFPAQLHPSDISDGTGKEHENCSCLVSDCFLMLSDLTSDVTILPAMTGKAAV